ncbi:hypothetical protein EV138_5737 [Kribbella voronezhensis]|uniref:Uncharacterized protein n=1 Tax=Kribbella voronezhensis TaxID=2512212 RepID=A0A4R7SWH0_9ACTN|nr:hypothetical protein [Kribbella voronezhensis]TDU83275.1 hypothetical protein EV138_5737 [Kribbella voronezhensis]
MKHFDPDHPAFVDVTVVEFAAHTAYLDPRTGTGYLITPRPESDVADPLTESGGQSLYDADRQAAFDHLAIEGWEPLLDEHGDIERAGWTTDDRLGLCLYCVPTAGEPSLEALSRALMALDIAAHLSTRSRHETNDQSRTD